MIVEFKNLDVRYNDKYALQDINLTINELEHTVILGANGSGKSTLIKLFSNDIYPIYKPNGVKKIFGKEVWNIFELKSKLGIVTNDLHYYILNTAPDISCFDVVISAFYSSIGIFESQEYTSEMYACATNAMEKIGIAHLANKLVCETSTGELRKCLIARALALNPKALLLDEPTVGLDIKAQIEFLEIIRKLSKEKTIILITHHIEEIFPEIKNVALLKQGKIMKFGNKQDVLSSENLSMALDINLTIGCNSDRYFIQNLA